MASNCQKLSKCLGILKRIGDQAAVNTLTILGSRSYSSTLTTVVLCGIAEVKGPVKSSKTHKTGRSKNYYKVRMRGISE